MFNKLSVVIEKDDEGYFAYCPELKGCMTQGDSFEAVMENLKEAIELYLETLTQDEKAVCLSKEIYTTSIEVAIA